MQSAILYLASKLPLHTALTILGYDEMTHTVTIQVNSYRAQEPIYLRRKISTLAFEHTHEGIDLDDHLIKSLLQEIEYMEEQCKKEKKTVLPVTNKNEN